MLKIFKAEDGTIYASTQNRDQELTVDDVLDFLSLFSGMVFSNTAASNTSFRYKDGVVSCDSLECWTDELTEFDYGQRIEDWFNTDEQYMDDSDFFPDF